MQSDAEYRYLLTDRDVDKLQMLISLLRSAVFELLEKRQLETPSELDSHPDYYEMRLNELSAKMSEPGSRGPNGRDIDD